LRLESPRLYHCQCESDDRKLQPVS
jgi:hypothetical protein